jgi:hypothetical protein
MIIRQDDLSIQFFLFVPDQSKSKIFYQQLFLLEPIGDVLGMAEFQLSLELKLGLMPASGISKILCQGMPDPALAKGISRCEMYWQFPIQL